MRNFIVHHYDRVDLEKLWRTANEDVPRIIRVLEPFLRERLPTEQERDRQNYSPEQVSKSIVSQTGCDVLKPAQLLDELQSQKPGWYRRRFRQRLFPIDRLGYILDR
jgi:hypothetical protein